MKAFCTKHHLAYEVSFGCPYCEKPKVVTDPEKPLYSLPENLRDKLIPKWNVEKNRWEIDSASLYTAIYYFDAEDWDFAAYGWEADYPNSCIFSPRSL